MEGPCISIVFATEDTVSNLEASLRSCVNQTYRNRELIVVDYGSLGSSREIMDVIVKEDASYVHVPIANRQVALNKGIEAASGEYVLCMDGGEEIHEQWLEKAVEWLARSTADAVRCATMYIGGAKSGEVDMPSESSSWYQQLLFAPQFELHAVIVSRDACASFPKESESLSDWEYWINTLRGRSVFVWPEYVGSFIHGDKIDPIRNQDPLYRMRRLQLMVKYRHEVKSTVRKIKYGFTMRSLYREYLDSHQDSGRVKLEESVSSCWWSKGLRRRSGFM